jgi:exodeoxyribonuclease VII large subunit
MNELNRDSAISVTALNDYIGKLMNADPILTNVHVRGELSNFKRHPSGHLYFSLKDETGVLRCVMFRSAATRLKFAPADGMKLVARGSVGVYSPTGQYQLYVQNLESDGVGELWRAFEALKNKLAAEGLFDEARKRRLPQYPTEIGIVTSPSGAAIQDLLNILTRRYPLVHVTLFPALVQGADAPATLIRGIRYFRSRRPDLIIIGRGGGAIEDLWCFNDEGLAREIAACEVPVISAVGHETDFTICDFVADLRAPTPSAAAELAVPDAVELNAKLKAMLDRARGAVSAQLKLAHLKLTRLSDARLMTAPGQLLVPFVMRVTQLEERLGSAMANNVTEYRHRLAELAAKLNALSPLAVLSRGYGIVSGEDGACIRSAEQVSRGQKLKIQLCDGEVIAEATDILKEKTL